ncbi:hypothetical protein ES702_00019 [subsurface metagenome]
MPKAKVCMLTSNHSALDDRIFYKECRSLQQAGYEVSLIAPLNNEGFLVDMGSNRIGKGEITLDDIKIIGFSRTNRGMAKISSGLELMKLVGVGKPKIGPEPLADLVNKGINVNADIYHCHEIGSLYAGIQIKKSFKKQDKRTKLIYDVHEFHPAACSNARNPLLSGLLRKIIIHFEKEALKYVDYIIAANQITRGYLLTLNRFTQTEVLYNCPVLSLFQEYKGNENHKNKVTICHEGSLGFNRGLRQMIEVMRILKGHYGNKVELLIVGDVYGEERRYLDEKLEEYDLYDTIRCTGWLPYKEVGKAISQCSIGIIFMEYTENNMLAGPPNKLFNYMRYSLSVVSVDLPETNRIISETQCGLTVSNRNIKNLVRVLSILIEDESKRRRMGMNAKKAVYNKYSWEQMEKKLLRVYEELG